MNKLYRIYDTRTGVTVANAIPDLKLALETLELIVLDDPDHTYEIETYTLIDPAVKN